MREVVTARCRLTILFLLTSLVLSAQMINPYVDNRRFHIGFLLGMNLMSYRVYDSHVELDGEIYHVRVSSLLPGFHVGFVSDLRLTKHLSLRFTPELEFSSRSISYKNESGNPIASPSGNKSVIDILSIPISVPLYLKFAADREVNYRPYVIGGGGFSYNVSRDREKPVLTNGLDYFVSVGIGCDIYLKWFKLCPEIKFQVGFADVLTPVEKRPELPTHDYFYTKAIKKMYTRMISLTFNFE